MKDKIFRPGEVLTIESNLRAIEKNLGHPIPGGFIDASELSDHILTTGEVLTVCQNIHNVRKAGGYNDRPRYNTNQDAPPMTLRGFISITLFLVVIGIIIKIIESILGLHIL